MFRTRRMRQAGSPFDCAPGRLCAPQKREAVWCLLQSEIANLESRINDARVAKLADAPDLGSGAERRAGSSPVPGRIAVSVYA